MLKPPSHIRSEKKTEEKDPFSREKIIFSQTLSIFLNEMLSLALSPPFLSKMVELTSPYLHHT
jgi:hypothetical protein